MLFEFAYRGLRKQVKGGGNFQKKKVILLSVCWIHEAEIKAVQLSIFINQNTVWDFEY